MLQVFPEIFSVELLLLLRVGDVFDVGIDKDDNKSLSDGGKELLETWHKATHRNFSFAKSIPILKTMMTIPRIKIFLYCVCLMLHSK